MKARKSPAKNRLPARRKTTKRKAEKPPDDGVWLTPSAFLRWLKSNGVPLSKKNLYRSYFGKAARHPVHTSPDGKRIHRDKGIELIRMIQSGDGTGDTARLIQERLAAEARHRAARARLAELELEETLGTRVPIAIVEKVWSEMIETTKNEARTTANNLPTQLEGKSKAEMRAVLDLALHGIFKHLATGCREKARAAAAAARTAAA